MMLAINPPALPAIKIHPYMKHRFIGDFSFRP